LNSKFKIILLALGHGLNDLIAGYFLGSISPNTNDLFQIGLAITVYNILAFGGQYPIAILMEKINDTKKIIVFSYILNVIAVAVFLFVPVLAIILAGIASAIYHVAGGTICAENNKAVNIGLFAAPGVAGLIAGGFLAWKNYSIIPFLLPIAILFLFILMRMKFVSDISEKNISSVETQKHVIDRHDIIMILLLMIISSRSVTWNVFQLIYENNYQWLIAIAIAAVIGKIAGGWLADKIGWRLYAVSSAIIATPLLTFFKKELLLFCLGIGLLQSGIPATTSLLIHSLKGKTSRGIALSFGAAIIIGSVASIFSSETLLVQMPYILLASIILLIICNYWYKPQGIGVICRVKAT
jgi:FSR family fosmidomycin resistance protein-like MFS transporter